MHYTYPAVFHREADGYSVNFPDFYCCVTEGDTLQEAFANASEALEGNLLAMLDVGEKLPEPSSPDRFTQDNENFVEEISTDINLDSDTKPVEEKNSIPRWLDRQVRAKNIDINRVAQTALINELQRI